MLVNLVSPIAQSQDVAPVKKKVMVAKAKAIRGKRANATMKSQLKIKLHASRYSLFRVTHAHPFKRRFSDHRFCSRNVHPKGRATRATFGWRFCF